ncbi:MAG TPA: DUF418 domain-containing protein [Candidatus Stackebrandtia excrementipullorum]|nr:DUF418 domain-containing protein [Candidatus Stackebrandtia excrementipullorum]
MTQPVLLAQPTPVAQRATGPDLARGLMLLLVAVVNVAIYLHGRPYGFRQHVVEAEPIDRITAAVVTVLADGRAYPMFAALFAYGLVTTWKRQHANGTLEQVARASLRRRHLWMIAFGAVHAALLFSGDILGLYGLMGLILVRFLRVSDRVLLWTAATWLLVSSAAIGFTYTDAGPYTERRLFWSFENSDIPTVVALRGIEWLMTPVGMATVFSAMLVVIWAARRDVMTDPGRHRRLLRRTAACGLTVAVIGGIPAGFLVGGLWHPAPFMTYLVACVHLATGVAGGIGYGALIALCARRPVSGVVTGALVAGGRRSLSMYLMQSTLFGVILMPYALDAGRWLSTFQATVLATLVWVGTLVSAVWMERRGIRGPAEVLLRRLTYGRRAH